VFNPCFIRGLSIDPPGIDQAKHLFVQVQHFFCAAKRRSSSLTPLVVFIGLTAVSGA
jgi:hypothetical protein